MQRAVNLYTQSNWITVRRQVNERRQQSCSFKYEGYTTLTNNE